MTSVTDSKATRPAPADAEALRTRVDEALAAFLGRQAELLAEVEPACRELVDSAATLIRGGKRLRPSFCYWGWRSAGGPADGAAGASARSTPRCRSPG